MKKSNVLYSFLSISFLVSLLSACSTNSGSLNKDIEDNRGEKVSESASYYHNNDFNDYVSNGSSKLMNQWENFGVSSPFILKHNGYYYLYCSTSSNSAENGVRAWKSRDLLNWEIVTAPGLANGYVVATTVGESAKARAPEVYYYNGYFYMYESYNAGTGHFVLRSKSPEGPFVALSKAVVDNKKDGTVIFGKNENPYFLTAAKGNINISTMQGMESIIDTNLVVSGTEVDAKMYAESPAIFEHLGKYYLLYSTGYDTLSGYHINYAVSDGWENETPSDVASSFKNEKHNLLLNSNSKQGFVGLGHPSIVQGPDLDSHYLVYDSLNSGIYNNHSLNIDRLLVSDNHLSIKHNRFNSIAPSLPEFIASSVEDFVNEDGYYLSSISSEDTFSAEYNFISAEKSELVFSYTDKNNYSYIKVDMSSSIKLCQKIDGVEKILKEIEFYNYFLNTDLHTISINYRNGLLDLSFENSLKLKQFAIELKGGKVGYLASEDLQINYTCFSNVGGGLSDQKEFKHANNEISSLLYDEKSSNVTSPIKEGNSEFKEANYKHLSLKHNEYARYNLNFNKSANYGVELLMSKNLIGKKVILEIDDEDNAIVNIPNIITDKDYIKVNVGSFDISSGLHKFKIQGLNDDFEFVSFTFKEHATKDYYLNATLSNENELRGLNFASDSRWNFINSKMVSYSNYRNMALSEEENLKDFDLSVNMALIGSDSIFSESSEAGILFRCSEYISYEDYMDVHSNIKMWNERYYAVKGYYLAFTNRKVTLYRFNTTSEDYENIFTMQYALGSKKERNIILKVRDDRFDVFVDEKIVVTFHDSLGYTSGAAGLYATGAEVAYSNLKIVSK